MDANEIKEWIRLVIDPAIASGIIGTIHYGIKQWRAERKEARAERKAVRRHERLMLEANQKQAAVLQECLPIVVEETRAQTKSLAAIVNVAENGTGDMIFRRSSDPGDPKKGSKE